MTELRDHFEEIQNTDTPRPLRINDFEFEKRGDCHEVTYKGHKIEVVEITTRERLEEYERTAELYETWASDGDLPNIGDWRNLYGDPYWKYDEASLQFRPAGSLGTRYSAQIRGPDYFNPDCLREYHHSKDSAVLNIILILVRYTPREVAYRHHYTKTIIDQLQEIRGIGEKTAKELYGRGVKKYEDVKKHRTVIGKTYQSDAIEQVTEKINNDAQLLTEEFLDNYSGQHMADKL